MDSYEETSVVGRGAHGVCHLCRRADGERVIVKQISLYGMSAEEKEAILGESPGNSDYRSVCDEAVDEVKQLQMLPKHPNVIGYDEHFVEEGALHIVMEYARGGTLSDVLEQRKGCPMDEERVLTYFTQILLSLHHLHSNQILHRDLKTKNILLNRARTVCKLSEFDISSKHLDTQSRAATISGTLNYLSPEILQGRTYYHKSDIWSLGCILYEMVTLKLAFNAPNLPALVMKIAEGKFDPIGDHVSAPLKSLISSLLDVDENRRPELKDILMNPLILPVVLRLTLDKLTVPLPLMPIIPRLSSRCDLKAEQGEKPAKEREE